MNDLAVLINSRTQVLARMSSPRKLFHLNDACFVSNNGLCTIVQLPEIIEPNESRANFE